MIGLLRRLLGHHEPDAPTAPDCSRCDTRMVFEGESEQDVRCPRCGHRAWMPKPKERP